MHSLEAGGEIKRIGVVIVGGDGQGSIREKKYLEHSQCGPLVECQHINQKVQSPSEHMPGLQA